MLDAASEHDRDKKRAEVVRILEAEPDLAADYASFVAIESLIEGACGLTIFDDRGAGPGGIGQRQLGLVCTPPVPSKAPIAPARQTTRGSWWGVSSLLLMPQVATAAALLLAAAVGWTWWGRAPLATVTAANDVQLASGATLSIGDDLGDKWIELESGSVRLALPNGVMASVDAPARVRVQASDHAELRWGAITAHVPEAGRGFRLSSAAGQIVDLGTGFRAVADRETGLAVHVTQGLVRLESNGGGVQELTAGELGRVSANGVLASSDRVRLKVGGQFRYVEQHPESLGLRKYAADDMASVFLESHAVRLPHDLRIDLASPGKYGDFTFGGQTAPAGSVVDCYLIHCAPERVRHVVKGSVRFNGPIVGVLGNDDRLNATNDLLGARWTLACQHPERGVESAPDSNSDVITISRDRRTLSAQFRTMSIDQVRVLVARDAG